MTNPLALPAHAWPKTRRRRPGARVLATVSFLFAGQWAALASIAWSRTPSYAVLYSLGDALFWLGIGVSLWNGDLRRLRQTVGAFVVFEGVARIGFGFGPFWAGFPFMRLAEGSILFAVGYGVMAAKEWGRRSCIVLGLAHYGWTLSNEALAYRMSVTSESDISGWLFVVVAAALFLVGPSIALALYCNHPSTRRQFAEDRADSMNHDVAGASTAS